MSGTTTLGADRCDYIRCAATGKVKIERKSGEFVVGVIVAAWNS